MNVEELWKEAQKRGKEVERKMINIYIDSDLKGPRGKASYGYVLEWERPGKPLVTREGFGNAEDTRNRVFLKATMEAMNRIVKAEELHIYEPCEYVTESASRGLLDIWNLQAWIKGDGKEVKNRDLWEPLMKKAKDLKPEWHSGKHRYSEWIKEEIERRKGNGTL